MPAHAAVASLAIVGLVAAAIAAATLWAISHFATFSQRLQKLGAPLQNEPGQLARHQSTRLVSHIHLIVIGLAITTSAMITYQWVGTPMHAILEKPVWFHFASITLASCAFAIAMIRLVKLWRQNGALKHRIVHLRRIAEQLSRVSGDHYRIFHDVLTGEAKNQRVDHVLIGVQGAFAITTLTVRNPEEGSVLLEGSTLILGETTYNLAQLREPIRRLQHAISKPLGRMIRLRSVIAIPGWTSSVSEFDDILIVGNQDLVMLQGWRNSQDSLLTEDARRLQDDLALRASL